jgi:outer membrane lipoprotein SlyB
MEKIMETRSYKFADLSLYVLTIVTIVMLCFSASSAHAQAGNVYGANQAQITGTAQEAQVLQVNIKHVEGGQTTNVIGTTVGSALGGLVLGSNQNLDWGTRSAAMLLGGALGGVIGNKVTNYASEREAQELVIGLKNPQTGSIGNIITVVQPAPFEALSAGDQVLVVNTAGATRIIKRTY